MSLLLFGEGDDLPLFSGCPPRADIPEFRPEEAVDKPPLLFVPLCKFCMDTGVVIDKGKKKKCWCQNS